MCDGPEKKNRDHGKYASLLNSKLENVQSFDPGRKHENI